VDEDLQRLLNDGQAVANDLAMRGEFMSGGVVSGLILAVRALRTKLRDAAEAPKDEQDAASG
jgi:hypothetical protein